MNMDLHWILRTDISGMPLEWVSVRDVIKLYYLDQVAYTCGDIVHRAYGGTCARTGQRSVIEINSILATQGQCRKPGFCAPEYVLGMSRHERHGQQFQSCLLRRTTGLERITPPTSGHDVAPQVQSTLG